MQGQGLNLVGMLRCQPHAGSRTQGEAGDMRLLDSRGLHEGGNIIRKEFGGIDARWFVRFASPSKVERDAGKVLGVLCHLEGITGMIGGQKRKENEGLTRSLLFIVHRDVVGFDLGHGNQSFPMSSVSSVGALGAKSYVSRAGKSMKRGTRRSVIRLLLSNVQRAPAWKIRCVRTKLRCPAILNGFNGRFIG